MAEAVPGRAGVLHAERLVWYGVVWGTFAYDLSGTGLLTGTNLRAEHAARSDTELVAYPGVDAIPLFDSGEEQRLVPLALEGCVRRGKSRVTGAYR
jgi:hypothetical protein